MFFTLDQEKAYDRLIPDFLWSTLETMGFSSQFIGRVRALQEDAETRILLEGDLLPAFHVQKGASSLDQSAGHSGGGKRPVNEISGGVAVYIVEGGG
ncbi:hypothetical protein R1sor_027367 [Riccia sorocarpa]|uniref:Reverse transcriptase domain-containing protein n=1 Tax=Riccia sorocarpa TaxID=122646 RepID=A0ABD3GJR5_9MARC